MKIITALTLLFSILPTSSVVIDHVDLAEINHFYDEEDGRLVFDQIIWYNWERSLVTGEYAHIPVDYRILTKRETFFAQEQRDKLENTFNKQWIQDNPGRLIPPYILPFMADSKYPRLNHKTKRWVSIFQDDKQHGGRARKVIAKYFRETWTPYDAELIARKLLVNETKRSLTNPRKD